MADYGPDQRFPQASSSQSYLPGGQQRGGYPWGAAPQGQRERGEAGFSDRWAPPPPPPAGPPQYQETIMYDYYGNPIESYGAGAVGEAPYEQVGSEPLPAGVQDPGRGDVRYGYDTYSQDVTTSSAGYGGDYDDGSSSQYPAYPEAGLYGDSRAPVSSRSSAAGALPARTKLDVYEKIDDWE